MGILNEKRCKPVYPIPTSVVYKIAYEYENEGLNCCCDGSCKSNS